MRAMQFPGFKYLVLRRTMPELRKSHFGFIEAEMKLLGAYVHRTDNRAAFETAAFSSSVTSKTKQRFSTSCRRNHDWIGFDELSKFSPP